MSILCQTQGENGEALTATQAATQLWTLYGASFETTATTLVWTLLLLAQHPAVAGRLLAELGGAVDPASPQPIVAAPPPLMTHVIKEAMRLCTPVPLQLRRVASQTVVPGAQAPLAKGDRIVISACGINRQADVFPDPLVFDPGRWACADAPDAALLAFSAGPRACMGYWFALSAMSAAIGAVWTRLRLAPVDGARIDYRTLITMAAGRTLVTLTSQDGAFAAARIGGAAPLMAPALASAG
jgi:cytochrome P450